MVGAGGDGGAHSRVGPTEQFQFAGYRIA
jgi:hypothetical protein